MTVVDEWGIRAAARDLVGLYRELDQAKYAKTRQPEIRTMRPAPGPRSPAPDHLISLDEELSSRLMEMVGECRTHVSPTLILHEDGGRLAGFVAWHAQAISELDVAEDLLAEMQDQARQIKRIVAPEGTATVAKRLEPYHRTEVILQRLARAGHHHTRDSLRMLANRSNGAITTEQHGGRTTYRYTEVLAHLTRNGKDEEP